MRNNVKIDKKIGNLNKNKTKARKTKENISKFTKLY